MKLRLIGFCVALSLTGISLAGEDISVDADTSGHVIESSEHPYIVGSLGAGRMGGENSLSGGIGIGTFLHESDDFRFFGELSAYSHGTYHTAVDSTCRQVVATTAAGRYERPREEKPKSPPPITPESRSNVVCDGSEVSADFQSALIELKMNISGGMVEPFFTAGGSVGDVKGGVIGAGLQLGIIRAHYRKFREFESLTFGVEIEIF